MNLTKRLFAIPFIHLSKFIRSFMNLLSNRMHEPFAVMILVDDHPADQPDKGVRTIF